MTHGKGGQNAWMSERSGHMNRSKCRDLGQAKFRDLRCCLCCISSCIITQLIELLESYSR